METRSIIHLCSLQEPAVCLGVFHVCLYDLCWHAQRTCMFVLELKQLSQSDSLNQLHVLSSLRDSRRFPLDVAVVQLLLLCGRGPIVSLTFVFTHNRERKTMASLKKCFTVGRSSSLTSSDETYRVTVITCRLKEFEFFYAGSDKTTIS